MPQPRRSCRPRFASYFFLPASRHFPRAPDSSTFEANGWSFPDVEGYNVNTTLPDGSAGACIIGDFTSPAGVTRNNIAAGNTPSGFDPDATNKSGHSPPTGRAFTPAGTSRNSASA